MRDLHLIRNAGGLAALGLACLAGCHGLGYTPAQRRAASPHPEPAAAVTRAQEADMQVALGRSAERRGEFDQAITAYQEALKRDKKRADASQRLAVLHDRRGDFRRSAELYKAALAADPGNPEIYADMGYSLYLQRRWAEAERNLRQAIALRPDMARAHNNLGLVLAHDRREEEALAEYRKAGNDEARARSNLALAQTLDGRVDEARAQYQKALAADPAAEPARARIGELDALIARTSGRSDLPPLPSPAARDGRVVTTSAAPPSSPPPAR